MKARWRALSLWFAALQQREKAIIAAATVIGIVMGGDALWVGPAQQRLAAVQKKIVKDKSDIQAARPQIERLKAQVKDPDASTKAALAEAKKRIAAVEQELRGYDNTLVPPERMPRLLESLFAHHRGLELVSLQTLPPKSLLEPPVVKAGAKPEAKLPDAKLPDVKGGGIQKHGIEIKMAGNYLDLLAYVSELEQLPQKLLWGSMSLEVKAYPKSELTLVVYTLSQDSIWLVV